MLYFNFIVTILCIFGAVLAIKDGWPKWFIASLWFLVVINFMFVLNDLAVSQ